MSYAKQNFKPGDVLLASQLNAMDDQIALNEAASKDFITSAGEYAVAAAASAAAAETSEEAAEAAAYAASGSADAASDSEVAANNSATAAALSAQGAYVSAAAADASETAAAASATAAAKSAQDAKDIRDSIPDYTDMIQEMADLKSALNVDHDSVKSIITKTNTHYPLLWEDGTISDGRIEHPSTTRKRTAEFIDVGVECQSITITIPSGVRLLASYYTSPSYDDYGGQEFTWTTGPTTVSFDASHRYFKIVADTPNSDARVDVSGVTLVLVFPVVPIHDDGIIRSTSLVDYDVCTDGKAISTAGAISNNSSYWITGFIPIGPEYGQITIAPRTWLRAVFFESDKSTVVSYVTHNPVTIPSTAAYVVVCVKKTSISFADRVKLFVSYPMINQVYLSQRVNGDWISVDDAGFIHLEDILKYSADTKTPVFTTSFGFAVYDTKIANGMRIIRAIGSYSGNAPTIDYRYQDMNNVTPYLSPSYRIGGLGDIVAREWLVPVRPTYSQPLYVTVTIPQGSSLTLQAFDIMPVDRMDKAPDTGTIYRAHFKGGTYAKNTEMGFYAASRCGLRLLITVPKRTSDGVWVCFHDDSNIGNTLCNDDGTNLDSAIAAKSISQMTWAELKVLDAGQKTYFGYKGERIATLDAFFRICSNTRMYPTLSIHPIPSESECDEIIAIAKKYGLENGMTIIDASSLTGANLPALQSTFGPTCTYMAVIGSTNDIDTVLTRDFDKNNLRFDTSYNASTISTLITYAHGLGYPIEAFGLSSADLYALRDAGLDGFTCDNHVSVGLDW